MNAQGTMSSSQLSFPIRAILGSGACPSSPHHLAWGARGSLGQGTASWGLGAQEGMTACVLWLPHLLGQELKCFIPPHL